MRKRQTDDSLLQRAKNLALWGLMDHWDEVLPGRVLRVHYEDTVDDLETQVKRILDYLELPWEDACLNYHETDRAVRTASSEQVRQPIYARSAGRWQHYAPYIGEYARLEAW